MSERLLCLSFHSVKGGVGKSTLSWLAAMELAKSHPTLLVDMDLTGTSLADVFPLRGPVLEEAASGLVLRKPPTGAFFEHSESRIKMEHRAQEADPIARHVPFLNDDFLVESDRFDADKDIDPRSLVWRVEISDTAIQENLGVIPSSALPNDLHRILPLIYDELYAGFLEARLEWFLARVLEKSNFRHIVFDSPPTIPGLSSALLSLATRLPNRVGLTDAGWDDTPSPLRGSTTSWTPVIVTTPDLQDLRAADRWLIGRPEHELAGLLVAVNRSRNGDSNATAHTLRSRLADSTNQSLGLELSAGPLTPEIFSYDGVILREDRVPSNFIAIAETDDLRLFESIPTALGANSSGGVQAVIARMGG